MWTESELQQAKEKLFSHCRKFIDDRISTIQSAIATAQDSANDETKSSAGDKYETGRAMMQIEIEQNLKQLGEANKQKAVLDQINPKFHFVTVQPGSLVITDNGNFFLAISVGQVQLEGKSFMMEGKSFMIVSAQSPAGSQLMGAAAGAVVSFANRRYTISQVS